MGSQQVAEIGYGVTIVISDWSLGDGGELWLVIGETAVSSDRSLGNSSDLLLVTAVTSDRSWGNNSKQ